MIEFTSEEGGEGVEEGGAQVDERGRELGKQPVGGWGTPEETLQREVLDTCEGKSNCNIIVIYNP